MPNSEKDPQILSIQSQGDMGGPNARPARGFLGAPAARQSLLGQPANPESQCCSVKVAQLCLTLCDPLDYTAHRILQARILEWVASPSPGNLPNPGIKPRSPAQYVDSLPDEPQGKPKNTGVGSLSLLQWIFSTQELNWGLLYHRQILYQLSHQGRYKCCSG